MAMARLLVRSALAAALLAVWACAEPASPPLSDDVPVRVDRVAIDDFNTPVVVLEEEGGPRWLPIWIGPAEARSIALQIQERESPRPNTHDLARNVIRGLQGRVSRVVVTELRGGTYYAILGLDTDDHVVEIDARPSDAIAIALRDGAPIFVRADLFGRSGSGPAGEPHPPETVIERKI